MANTLRNKIRRKVHHNGAKRGKQLHLARISTNHAIPAVENLRIRLSSPRLKSPRTLEDYIDTCSHFMRWLGSDGPPTEHDLLRYFMYRRDNGISERTLRKEFFQIKKLCESNHWPWTFTKDDAPVSRTAAFQPAYKVREIEQLVGARKLYTPAEVFYLAMSTTYGSRREELATLKKRDWDDQVVTIHIAKKKGMEDIRKKHLIPDQLKPIFVGFHPTLTTPTSLTYVFHRICEKAGVQHEKNWGWHSIRRTVETALKIELLKADYPESWVADFMGWSKVSKGSTFAGAPMVGIYDHPEILSDDPWYQEKAIIAVHPFLPFWGGKVPEAPRRRK